MQVTSDHVTGFVIGLGVAASGFYLYKVNQKEVDAWLERQGIHVPGASASDYSSMTLAELVREKEKLEDLIAEREFAGEQKAAPKKSRSRAKRAGAKARQAEQAPAV